MVTVVGDRQINELRQAQESGGNYRGLVGVESDRHEHRPVEHVFILGVLEVPLEACHDERGLLWEFLANLLQGLVQIPLVFIAGHHFLVIISAFIRGVVQRAIDHFECILTVLTGDRNPSEHE